MSKNFKTTAMLVGLALSASTFALSPARAVNVNGIISPIEHISPPSDGSENNTASQEQTPLQIMQAAIEQLIVDNAGDADALKQAIEDYVASSSDPETAAKAVIAAITDPQSDEAKQALADNAELADAAGEGLGAAITTIALTNPDAATAMQASVDASGSDSLANAVSKGSSDKTATIQQQQQQQQQETQQQQSQTPEKTGSQS